MAGGSTGSGGSGGSSVEEPPKSEFELVIRKVRRVLRSVGPKLRIVPDGCHPGCGTKCGEEVETRNSFQILEEEEKRKVKKENDDKMLELDDSPSSEVDLKVKELGLERVSKRFWRKLGRGRTKGSNLSRCRRNE